MTWDSIWHGWTGRLYDDPDLPEEDEDEEEDEDAEENETEEDE